MSEDPDKPLVSRADALIVLGCRARAGQPSSALKRRLEVALRISSEIPHLPCIMSGGTLWDGYRECHVMERYWIEQGGDQAHLLLEEESQNTQQNARESRRLCKKFNYDRIILVTCDFHMKRASRLFKEQGLSVVERATTKSRTLSERMRLSLREWAATQLEPWERRFP